MTPSQHAAARRPVGRPRKNGRPHLTRPEVFLAAARLIHSEGYAGASIRLLARDLSISTASLFNLFPSKDALLNDLVVFLGQFSLEFYRRLSELSLTPEVALYKSLYEETFLVSSSDEALTAIFYLPELRKPQFAPARAARAALVAHYRRLIEAGCANGSLACDLPALAAEQMFQLSETSVIAAKATPAPDQARATARLALRAILAKPARLDRIEAEALQVPLAILGTVHDVPSDAADALLGPSAVRRPDGT